MSLDDRNLSAAWQAYKRTKDPAAREQLIVRYAPLVKYVAGRVSVGLPPNVDLDDLVSYGVFGLIDAVDKFEPAREVKFETYAISRIRGAIIDGLRAMDWVPRSMRQKARELERTIQELETRLGRSASDEELAAALQMSTKDLDGLTAELAATSLGSLDDLLRGDNDGEDGVRVADTVCDRRAADPLATAEFSELKRALAASIDQLSERERLVIALYYYEGLTLKEIGRVLEVTEARVSQIHSKAVLRLRARMGRWREPDQSVAR